MALPIEVEEAELPVIRLYNFVSVLGAQLKLQSDVGARSQEDLAEA